MEKLRRSRKSEDETWDGKEKWDRKEVLTRERNRVWTRESV